MRKGEPGQGGSEEEESIIIREEDQTPGGLMRLLGVSRVRAEELLAFQGDMDDVIQLDEDGKPLP